MNKMSFLDKISSAIVLKKVFNALDKHKRLKYMNRNKKLRRRLDINVNDYRLYYENKTPIIIEIIPIENHSNPVFTPMDEYKKYITYKIENGHHIINVAPGIKTLEDFFYNQKNIEGVVFQQFLRRDIEDMSDMFSMSTNLKYIDFRSFYSKNVKDMAGMFFNCSKLLRIDNIQNLDTSNVENMEQMFAKCEMLFSLDLSNFNTKKCKNIESMFYK